MNIRPAVEQDRDAIWNIFHGVVAAGDTYAFDPQMSREDALAYWFRADTHATSPNKIDPLRARRAADWINRLGRPAPSTEIFLPVHPLLLKELPSEAGFGDILSALTF